MDPHQDRRRGHFHRGRRGSDRRGFDRRTPAPPQPPQTRDQIDVEQIMREIRARIAQRQGVELSHQQIDELAARRLEYILDPRAVKPEFLDRLRRTADDAVERQETRLPAEPVYEFEGTTLYDSHRAILRFIRRLLNPLLKLFFNPNPLIRALHLQAKLNVEAAERDAARDRRQAEWNALHYTIVQRLVTEVSRLSLEVQALSARVESLGARVDFADRRVRAVEGTVHQQRPGGRPAEPSAPARPPEAGPSAEAVPDTGPAEGGRRRRRRRRGRRGATVAAESATTAGVAGPGPAATGGELEAGGALEVEDELEADAEPDPAVEPEGGADRDAGADPEIRGEVEAGGIDVPLEPEPAAWTSDSLPAPAPPDAPEAEAAPPAEEPAPAPPPAAEGDDRDRLE